jgi:hypothetical protein
MVEPSERLMPGFTSSDVGAWSASAVSYAYAYSSFAAAS